jgi:hypothetical protein
MRITPILPSYKPSEKPQKRHREGVDEVRGYLGIGTLSEQLKRRNQRVAERSNKS